MRFILLIGVMLQFSLSCIAATDDTLPTNKSSRFLAFPFLLRSPETSWGFGAATVYFFKPKKNFENDRTSDINLIALYTLRKQIVFVLGSTIYFPGEKNLFRFQSSYSYYPDKFWGIGNKTDEQAKEDYSLKQFFFNPQFLTLCYQNLYAGISVEMQNVTDFSYSPGGVFDEQDVVGKNGGFTSGVGLLLAWDTRNNAYSPSRGFFAEINVTRFDDKVGSDFNFTSCTFDLRKFISIGVNRVLGLQAYSKLNNSMPPVRNLSMLGGTEIMRGYYKGRYADQNMVAFQAEVRQYLFWRLGVVGFAAAGQVSSLVNDFGINDFHYAYGGGLRIMLQEKEKLNLRVDFGFAEKSSGVYVILKEAF